MTSLYSGTVTTWEAHARSGDASMIYGYLGKSDVFDRAVGTFAKLYADQTERDSELYLDAIESGESKAVKEKQIPHLHGRKQRCMHSLTGLPIVP
jgi:hypothetical protein